VMEVPIFQRLDSHFGVTEAGSTISREVGGGVTTFLAMAYILFVQPTMLAAAGMDRGAVLTATCLSAALATLVMGLWARYPVALAPGMGLNAFFAFTVCGVMGIPWQQALGLVLCSGVLFLLLGLFRLRDRIVEMLPEDLQHAIAAGIGIFIAFIGFKEAGFLVPDANVFVALGDISARWQPVLTASAGLLVAAVLMARGVMGALMVGIGVSLVVALLLDLTQWSGLVSPPPSMAPTAFQLELSGLFTLSNMGLILLFLYTDLFDTVGTLLGVATQAGLLKEGRLERGDRAFFADAIGTTVGALLGTSTVTSYIESTAGVEVGARTGLASVVTGLLFLAALFFYPLAEMVGGAVPVETMIMTSSGPVGHTLFIHPITASALILVGAMMARSLGSIKWASPQVAIPAFLVLIGIPLTFSIAHGISFGIIAWAAIALLSGQAYTVSRGFFALAAILVAGWLYALFG
jgi:AGZA family xanthine/uracil permease-like MFS transporter